MMGDSKKTEVCEESDDLAGDSMSDQLTSLNRHFRSPAVFLRMYAFHFSVAIAAFIYAIGLRNYRIAIVGAGLCIRPIATWVAFSDISEPVKAVVAKSARALRVAFVIYCVYLGVSSL